MAAKTKLSSFRTEIEVNGATQAANRLRSLGERAYNTGPLMEELSHLLFDQQRARAETKPWAPLSPKTIANKSAQGENPEIFRTEWRPINGKATRMADALWSVLTIDGADGQVKRFTRASAVFGFKAKGTTNLFYALPLIAGKGRYGDIPKRRILGISAGDAAIISMTVAMYIDRAWEMGVDSTGRESNIISSHLRLTA